MIVWAVAMIRHDPVTAPEDVDVVIYTSASCKCYRPWGRALQRAGLKVGVVQTRSVLKTQLELGVPREFSACHTAAANGYWFEGHVPAASITALLMEKPDNISGLAHLRAEQQTGERLLWEVVSYDAKGDPILSIPQVEEFIERGEEVIHEL